MDAFCTNQSNDLAEQLRDFCAEVSSLVDSEAPPLTEALACWLSAHYVVAAREIARDYQESGGTIPLGVLRGMTSDVVALRKGDQSAARLLLDRDRLEIEREKNNALLEEQSCGGLSQEERNQRIREIFGLSRKPSEGLSPETLEEMERAAKLP